jgi:L-2-hydroxyglutarate oxidase
VVGAGLVGLGAARALRRRYPEADITVLEKEHAPGQHQSTHNSGVLHAGLYYRPGSARARLAVRGIRLMKAFCERHGVAHELCGKIVVAADDAEIPRLRALHERGEANGLTGLRWLTEAEAKEREPAVRARAALLVPEEGIVDFAGVVRALAAELAGEGVRIVARAPVTGLTRIGTEWAVRTGDAEPLTVDYVVTCAGLQSDRLARLAGARTRTRIVPFRGEYFTLRPEQASLVKHLIYPVPDPRLPFLGVHFTRMIGGGMECGPNAVLAFAREGYRASAFNLTDALDALTFPGLWRFAAQYPGVAWFELRRSMSRAVFARSLQRLVPDVTEADLEPGIAGVRAQAMRPDGTLVDDFEFVEGPMSLHVLNAPSPAATASLAIGEEIAARVNLAS